MVPRDVPSGVGHTPQQVWQSVLPGRADYPWKSDHSPLFRP
jgi:hypothetical protein